MKVFGFIVICTSVLFGAVVYEAIASSGPYEQTASIVGILAGLLWGAGGVGVTVAGIVKEEAS